MASSRVLLPWTSKEGESRTVTCRARPLLATSPPPLSPTHRPHRTQGPNGKYAEYGGSKREMCRPSPKCSLSPPVSFLPLSLSLSHHHHPRPISLSRPRPIGAAKSIPTRRRPRPRRPPPAADPRKTQVRRARLPRSGPPSPRFASESRARDSSFVFPRLTLPVGSDSGFACCRRRILGGYRLGRVLLAPGAGGRWEVGAGFRRAA